jgi:hypothetical protein
MWREETVICRRHSCTTTIRAHLSALTSHHSRTRNRSPIHYPPTIIHLVTPPTPTHTHTYTHSLTYHHHHHNNNNNHHPVGVKDVTISQFPRCWQNNTHYEDGPKPGDENNRTASWESMSDCHWTDRCEQVVWCSHRFSLSDSLAIHPPSHCLTHSISASLPHCLTHSILI